MYKPSSPQRISLWLYTLVLHLLLPFALLHILIKQHIGKLDVGRSSRLLERLGAGLPQIKTGGVLFHCVSVGEVVSASCVIKRLQQLQPDLPITLTTTTATGSARVKAIFADSVHHCYLSYDLPWAMDRMLKRIQPKLVCVVEVELWPNMIDCCWKRAIPTIVINGRMTARSVNRYRKMRGLFQPMLEKLTQICVQGESDYYHYLALGAEKQKLLLTQNLKFDQAHFATPSNQDAFCGITKSERSVIVGGSTHEGEEQMLIDALVALKPEFPALLLVLVPRHPERFIAVEKLLNKTHLNWQSTIDKPSSVVSCDILLVNEMGKLNQAYQIATVAFVGGSIADKGGHNALEPAAVSLPILMGPNTYNNPVICQTLMDSGALNIVHNAQQIEDWIGCWLRDESKCKLAGEAAHQVIQDNQGALDKTIGCLMTFLSEK